MERKGKTCRQSYLKINPLCAFVVFFSFLPPRCCCKSRLALCNVEPSLSTNKSWGRLEERRHLSNQLLHTLAGGERERSWKKVLSGILEGRFSRLCSQSIALDFYGSQLHFLLSEVQLPQSKRHKNLVIFTLVCGLYWCHCGSLLTLQILLLQSKGWGPHNFVTVPTFVFHVKLMKTY